MICMWTKYRSPLRFNWFLFLYIFLWAFSQISHMHCVLSSNINVDWLGCWHILIGKFVSLNREISWILRPVAKWVLSVRTVGAKTYLAVNLIIKSFKRTKMNRSWFITSPHETMFGVNAGSARLTCRDMLEKLTASQQRFEKQHVSLLFWYF